LLSTIGSIGLIVYLVVACSQYALRRKYDKQGIELNFKMWLFPWITLAVIALIVMTLGYMFIAEKYQYESMMTASLTAIILVASFIRGRQKQKNSQYALNSEESSN
jgi:GABA permease